MFADSQNHWFRSDSAPSGHVHRGRPPGETGWWVVRAIAPMIMQSSSSSWNTYYLIHLIYFTVDII